MTWMVISYPWNFSFKMTANTTITIKEEVMYAVYAHLKQVKISFLFSSGPCSFFLLSRVLDKISHLNWILVLLLVSCMKEQNNVWEVLA
ncbi:hypothetical protein L1887_40182 [Cichorium endivia]|nr:hypothetical protein L1887_40182 [Cichorium endivia]